MVIEAATLHHGLDRMSKKHTQMLIYRHKSSQVLGIS